MNDFFLANNESVSHEFIDQKIQILQIQVKNLDRFAKHANELKENLESYSIEAITPLIEPHTINVMGVCSLATTLDADHFMKHSADIAAISEMVLMIIQVNEAFFKKEKQRDKQQDKSVTWFDSFQYLISCGHRHNDIMNMSYSRQCGGQMSVNPSLAVSLVMLQALVNSLDTGSENATFIFYDDTKPVNTTILADNNAKLVELTLPKPCFKQVLPNGIELHPSNTGIVIKTGVATWARLFDSQGQVVADFAVGADIVMATVDLTVGGTLSMPSIILEV